MKTIFAFFIMAALCFGQGTPVRFSEQVLENKNRIEEGYLPNHQDWIMGNLSEYEIVNDKNLGGYRASIEKITPLSVKYVDDVLILENSLDTNKFIDDLKNHKYRNVSIDAMLPACKYVSKDKLNFMRNEIQFDNHEAQYLDGVLYKLTVRYRRVFNGGVVRNNLSYIEVKFNMVDGDVEKIEMKWPTFKKIPGKNESLSSDEIFTEYKRKASLHGEVFNERGDTLIVDSISTVGSSFAWCQVENRIVPAMSFIQQVNFGKDKIHTFVDVPYLRKYLRD